MNIVDNLNGVVLPDIEELTRVLNIHEVNVYINGVYKLFQDQGSPQATIV